MPHYLDLERWPRRAAFDFFRAFDSPFFSITAPVQVGPLLAATKAAGVPFSAAVMYLALRAANDTEPFRYRIDGGRVLVHEVVHGSQAELLPDDRLAFCYTDFAPTFAEYLAGRNAARAALLDLPPDAPLDARPDQSDLLYFSIVPWISFTAVTQAKRFGSDDSVPRLVFGRYERKGDEATMPVSVEAHHALMDGLHVGRFFERFERLCLAPYDALGLPPEGGA